MRHAILTEIEIDQRAKLHCQICEADVALATIKKQKEQNWVWRIIYLGHVATKLACGYCAHAILEEHDPVPTGHTSSVCRCGMVIHGIV